MFGAPGIPAVAAVGERRAPAGGRRDRSSPRGCTAFGRAALRSVDRARRAARRSGRAAVAVPWSPAQGAAGVGGAAARRRAAAARRCWSPSTASRACAAAASRSARGCGGWSPPRAPFALALAFARRARRHRAAARDAAGAGRRPGAIPLGTARTAALVAVVLVVAARLARAAARAAARTGGRRGTRPRATGAGGRAAGPGARCAAVLWVATRSPRRCSCPALHLWLPSIAPEVRLRRGARASPLVVRRPLRRSCSSPVARRRSSGSAPVDLGVVLAAARRGRRRRRRWAGSSGASCWRCARRALVLVALRAARGAGRRGDARRSPCAAPLTYAGPGLARRDRVGAVTRDEARAAAVRRSDRRRRC